MAPPHNLPPQPGPLIGRTHESAALRVRLVRDGTRLLTLTGSPGTGKTRLALAIAASVVTDFADGAWFVDLTSVSDPDDVLPRIGAALGLRGAGSEAPPHEHLPLHLRERQLLLVLDNFEHVLAAGPAIARLVQACPEVAVLATSREPLRVRWEQVCPIEPLAVPAPNASPAVDVLAAIPSVALFVQRAREVRPDFELDPDNAAAVAELCRQLDGLPLAIELAAARSRALPPSAILARLERRLDLLVGGRRDEPARHQTIRAALDWSHGLLNPAEQTLFRRLAVFRGGFTVDGATAINGPPARGDALDALESLLDRGLLKQQTAAGEPRFSMLETIHAYAQDALEASGEGDAIRARHAQLVYRQVDQAAQALRGPRQMHRLAQLDAEFANIRAALRWLTERAAGGDAGAVELGLRVGGGLWWYMHVRGIYAEMRELLVPLVGLSDASDARALAQCTLGVGAWGLGDFAAARIHLTDSLAWFRACDDRRNVCQTLVDLACLSVSSSDGTTGVLCAEALALATELHDEWLAAWALVFQGTRAITRADLDRAAAKFDAALALSRGLGDPFGQAWASNGLASVARLRGDAARARPLFEQALVTFRALGERPTVASILDGLGEVELAERDFAQARARFAESLALYRAMDSRRGIGIAVSGFAAVAAAEGQPERAVRLAGAAAALHEAGGGALELIQPRDATGWLAAARQTLGEPAATHAWSAGQTLGLEATLEETLRARPGPPTRRTEMPLTLREQEVARLVAQGTSNRRIAETLVIGERTVEAHVSHILAKLGLDTRVQLAAWAVARGLADPLSV